VRAFFTLPEHRFHERHLAELGVYVLQRVCVQARGVCKSCPQRHARTCAGVSAPIASSLVKSRVMVMLLTRLTH
jgi:hypothetical protein